MGSMAINSLIILLFIISFLWSMRDVSENARLRVIIAIAITIVLFALGWAGLLLDSFSLFMFPFALILLSTILWLLYGTYVNVRLRWHVSQQENNSETQDKIGLLVANTDDWETTAIAFLRQQNELTAIELVQQNTGLDFEQSRVKLYKLDDASLSRSV